MNESSNLKQTNNEKPQNENLWSLKACSVAVLLKVMTLAGFFFSGLSQSLSMERSRFGKFMNCCKKIHVNTFHP